MSSGVPHLSRNGMSVVNGKTAVSKPSTVFSSAAGTSRTTDGSTRSLSASSTGVSAVRRSHGAEHHFGRCVGRDHVRRHSSGDEADGVVCAAEQRVRRQFQSAQTNEGVDQLLDRRLARLGIRRMGGPPTSGQLHAERASVGCPKTTVGRLAVDQKAAVLRPEVRGLCAVTTPLLPNDEEHAEIADAALPQTLRCGHLRGEDALGVARAAAVEPAVQDPAREERRHAVEVRREHHMRRLERGQHVEPAVRHGLLFDAITPGAEVRGQPPPAITLAPRRGIDVDERARQREQTQRIHCSSSVRVSVRASRYFTITGVASDRPHAAP